MQVRRWRSMVGMLFAVVLAVGLAVPVTEAAAATTTTTPAIPTPPVGQLSAGNEATCSVSAGTVRCWGSQALAQPGTDGTLHSSIPIVVAGLSGVSAVSTGGLHTCALISGTVKCWGSNNRGQLGNGTTTDSQTPVGVTGITGATAIAVGLDYSCALITGGTVKCWGDNYVGELGHGAGPGSSIPVPVSSLVGVTAIASSQFQVCAVVAAGAVKCWGSGVGGQLGTNSSGPIAIAGVTGATAVAPGEGYGCALLTAGTVMCWGDDSYGQLGNGSLANTSYNGAVVGGLSGVVQVTTGYSASCALLNTGSIRCWGYSLEGELGNGVLDSSTTSPVAVPGLTGMTAIAEGGEHVCALGAAGSIACWGENLDGEVGNGGASASPVAQTVPGATAVRSVTAANQRTCAVTTAGALTCWGELTRGSAVVLPAPYPGVSTVATLAISGTGHPESQTLSEEGDHACALLLNGTVTCWGENRFGELGNGTTAGVGPVSVSGLTGATAVAVGETHSCAIVAAGAVKCWGDNGVGQLGNGSTANSAVPVAVPGIVGATALAAGADHTCAIVAAGAVKCWGDDTDGELGNGKSGAGVTSATPVAVAGLTAARTISAASAISPTSKDSSLETDSTCASLADGTVRCWGASGGATPAAVAGITGASSVGLGADHACALITGGTVRCWGDNDFGQIGSGALYGTPGMTTVTGVAGATSLTVGYSHSCVVLTGGSVRCWGSNEYGQLGVPSLSAVAIPTAVVLPNLTVTSVAANPTSPATGQAVTFAATVKNTGTAPTPAGAEIGVNFQIDGKTVTWSDTDTTSLAPGATVTLTANGGPAAKATWIATVGTHTLTAYADEANFIAESNETDNTLSSTITVVNRPDLIVTTVNSTPIVPAVGQAATFSATVKNTGLAPTPAGAEIGVNFQIDGKTVTWSDTDTTSLAPGATVTLTANGGPAAKATWTATAGAHTLTAYADEANFIAESNESNNTLSATLTVP